MRQKQQQQLIEDSKNSKTKNLIKRHRKIWPKDYLNLDSKGKKKSVNNSRKDKKGILRRKSLNPKQFINRETMSCSSVRDGA